MHRRHRLSRRGALERLAALSALALVDPARAFAQAQEFELAPRELELTPREIAGPFYPIVKPLERDSDLTIVDGGSGPAEGQVVHLMGTVVNRKGEPVAGAQIELWQANTYGRYAHPDDINPAPLDPNFQGFAVQVTDADGRYRFKTIKPGAYPVNPRNPTSIRTPHLHFDIRGRRDRLVTQMYFPGEPLNAQDEFRTWLGARAGAVTAAVLPPPPELEPDSLLAVWDVVLEQG